MDCDPIQDRLRGIFAIGSIIRQCIVSCAYENIMKQNDIVCGDMDVILFGCVFSSEDR